MAPPAQNNRKKAAPSSGVHSLIHRCMHHLQEIQKITNSVTHLIESDSFENIEPLFKSRGEELRQLAELEAELNRLLSENSGDMSVPDLNAYVSKRTGVIEHVQEQDRRIGTSMRSLRDVILSEIKELRRGKTMHNEYVNSATFASGFIDIKE